MSYTPMDIASRVRGALSRRRTSSSMARGVHHLGVTLVELMIVLIVLAIVLAAAFPTVIRVLRANDVYEAARDVSQTIKAQRYRAQNYNRAAGIYVSSAENAVYGHMSTSGRCGDMVQDLGVWTLLTDLDDDHPYAKIRSATTSPGMDTFICIRPDGRVLDAASGQPFTGTLAASSDDMGGALQFEVGNVDGSGRSHIVFLPFNGVVRLEEGAAPST